LIKSKSQTRVDPNILSIAEEYVQKLKNNKIPLVKTILYGSQARGTSDPDSDIDILVVVESLDKSMRSIIIDEAFEISLQNNVDLIALPCDKEEYNSPFFQADHFYKNIEHDGVILS